MKLKAQLSIWCGVSCSVLQGHVPDGWLFITIRPTPALITVIRTWKYWQSWDPCCETWGPWKSKMSWGIVLHSRVLTAKEVVDNFNKMIAVGNVRLNITLLRNLPTWLPCQYYEVTLRSERWCTVALTQGQWGGSQSSFQGATPVCCWAPFQGPACPTVQAW